MEVNNFVKTISQANFSRYSDGSVIENYLLEKYHKKRIGIALDQLRLGILKSFPIVEQYKIEIIDLGCGSGVISKKIIEMGFSVTAADQSIEQIDQGIKNRSGFDANFAFPLENDSFHGIFMGELIEHIFDTEFFLEECRRILKPGGVLVITTPNLAGLSDRIRFLFGQSPRHVNPTHKYLKLHIRPFTKVSLATTLKKFKFKDVVIKSNYLKIYITENIKVHIRIIAWIFPGLGGSLICSAKKACNE